MSRQVLIVGASARAAAESARRAGWLPHAIDLFADQDLQQVAASVQRCPIDQYPHRLPELAAKRPGMPLLLTGAMENHLTVAAELEAGRELVGSSAAAMGRARRGDVFTACRTQRSWRCPPLRGKPPTQGQWLLKPRRSAGGHGIQPWQPGMAITPDHVLQQYVVGTAIAAVYRDGALLGVSEQLVGDTALGARPFHYCGSVGPLVLPAAVKNVLRELGTAVARHCGLHGLFGIDAILDPAGDVWPLEINPRYTASVELLERAVGRSAFLHPPERWQRTQPVRSRAPSPSRGEGLEQSAAFAERAVLAKGIVFATRDVAAVDMSDFQVSDISGVGEAIAAGRPVCTLWAHGPDRDEAVARLHAAARRLYDRLHA